MIKIRQAHSSDLSEILPLFRGYLEFYKRPFNEPVCRDFLSDRLKNNESVIFLASNPSALGFCQLYPTWSSLAQKRMWILNDLFTAPEARNTGVAQELLKEAVEFSRRSGARGLSLQTAVNNVKAQSLYEKMGWKKDEDFFTYYFF